MNIFALTSIMAALSCITLALFVFSRGVQNQVNRSFAIITAFAGIWTLFPFVASIAENNLIALRYDRLIYAAAVFVPAAFLNFVINLIGNERTKGEHLIITLSYITSALFLFLNFTPLLIQDIVRSQPQFYVVPGLLYPVFVLYFGAVCLYAFVKLLYAYRVDKGSRKNQYKYIFIAFSFAYLGGLMHFLPAYLGPRAELFPHDILLIAFASIVSYSILQRRLLDIEIVIKKTALYSILTALLTGLFVSLILIGQRIFSGLTGYSSAWAGITGAFIVALVFQPLRDGLQQVVDRIFFRARYNYQRILNKYSFALVRPMANLDRFSNLTPYLLAKSMQLSGASFMALDRQTHAFIVRAGKKDALELEGVSLPENSVLINELQVKKKELSLEQIEARLKDESLSEPEKGKLRELAAAMKKLKTALIIPSISESEYFKESTLLATINLGQKLSDESFSKEDTDFLETLANQAAINIEYAFILEELKKNQAQIVKSEKLAALGATVAGIAHELKNPLTYLLIIGQAMAASWDNKAFKESVIKTLPSEVERMKLIIDGLSDYSKSHELRLEPVDLAPVIEKVLAILGYEIKKNNVNVVKNYPAENEAKVIALADKDRIVQVFMNIIANAIQAMADKGGQLSLTARKNENEVQVSVADTGPGIPPDKLQQIFDPFFTTKETGTGLGLSITKRIVDEHKGSIRIDSRVGKGTTFTICLPAA